MIKVKYFGLIAEITGSDSEDVDVDEPVRVGVFRQYLIKQYASLKNTTFKIAVDKRIAEEDALIAEGSEVALLPPYAGG